MKDFQKRVIEEKNDLNLKIEELSSFFKTDIFDLLPKEEQVRLIRQHFIMKEYAQVLKERINAFNLGE